MSIEKQPGGRVERAPRAKRSVDLILAALGAPFALPACIIAALFIRAETPGSPVFAQERLGKDQKPIVVYKLRTMYNDTKDLPSHAVSTAKITRVGSFLRRTKVDELPQIWNVLRGDMSFVGPRPCLPSQSELIEEREARGVFTVVPGITGPGQLAGIDMSTPVELAEADGQYLQQQSLIFDLGCIISTALGRGSGDAAGNAPAEANSVL